MIERIKQINNPLTIIAIFAGIAEVSLSVALKFLIPDLHHIFIWFLMGFPVLLIVLFFLTLNFNHAVLYAPSDFKNEENFMDVVRGRTRLAVSVMQTNEQLDVARNTIMNEIGAAAIERDKLSQVITQQFELIQDKIERSRESISYTTSPIPQILNRDTRAVQLIDEIKKRGISRSADAEKVFVKEYVNRYGLEDYLVDHEVDQALVRRLLKESRRVGEFLDYISRRSNLTFMAMEAITSLYVMDNASLQSAYDRAKHEAPDG